MSISSDKNVVEKKIFKAT